MTQQEKTADDVMEFHSLFLSLDERKQDQILVMLHSLEYAQTVTGAGKKERKAVPGHTK